jgi:hypothetical protein
VLQFGYDVAQDDWMYESTATWAEEKVFETIDDYLLYLPTWASLPHRPLTEAGTGKEYGSAIWNRWLDDNHGHAVVREAWADSVANFPSGRAFAPGAYDDAIADASAGASNFRTEFEEFTTATAEWRATNSGIHEGPSFPGDVAGAGTLALNASPIATPVDHTAFKLFTVPSSSASELVLTGNLPAGTAGSFAIVGLAGDVMTTEIRHLPEGGRAVMALANPAQFDRITAVVTNSDAENTGFNGGTGDWRWTRDAQCATLAVAEPGSGPADGPAPTCVTVQPQPTPTPTPTVTATPTVTPPPPPPPPPAPPIATSVRLRTGTLARMATLARRGYLPITAVVSEAGALTATAKVDRATARRLRVGRRATRIGTGRRTATSAGSFRINLRLTKKARAGFKRQKRTLRVSVRTVFTPADGGPAVVRKLSLLLRP